MGHLLSHTQRTRAAQACRERAACSKLPAPGKARRDRVGAPHPILTPLPRRLVYQLRSYPAMNSPPLHARHCSFILVHGFAAALYCCTQHHPCAPRQAGRRPSALSSATFHAVPFMYPAPLRCTIGTLPLYHTASLQAAAPWILSPLWHTLWPALTAIHLSRMLVLHAECIPKM